MRCCRARNGGATVLHLLLRRLRQAHGGEHPPMGRAIGAHGGAPASGEAEQGWRSFVRCPETGLR
jgi:hypothetical protein